MQSQLIAASIFVEQYCRAHEVIKKREIKTSHLESQELGCQITDRICTHVGNYDNAIRYAKKGEKTEEMAESRENSLSSMSQQKSL